MYFSLLPLDTKTVNGATHRGPLALRWRLADGLDLPWSLKDFNNDIPFGIVATETPIPAARKATSHEALGILSDAGVPVTWIKRAGSEPEKLHRLFGVVFAMQAGIDRPDVWLGRDMHFGFGTLSAWDKEQQAAEQEASLPRLGEWVLRGRAWVSAITGRMIPVIAGGALPATDVFTNTNGTVLSTHNANWVRNSAAGTLVITSNALRAAYYTDDVIYHWAGDTFANDQYSQATFTAIASNYYYMGLAVRAASGATDTEYYFTSGGVDTNVYVFKRVTGTSTNIQTVASSAFAVNDVARMESEGTTIRVKKNGTAFSTNTDSSISSGYAGVAGTADADGTRIDSWEGGNLSAGSGVIPPKIKRLYQAVQRANL